MERNSQKCHAFLEQSLGVARALLTTSCTHALEMAAFLLDVKPGDEIIVPSLLLYPASMLLFCVAQCLFLPIFVRIH